MMSAEVMRSVNLNTVDRSTLIQRSTVEVDDTAEHDAKLEDYIRKIKNPYCYLDGKTAVKITFAKTTLTLEDSATATPRSLRKSRKPFSV